MKGKRTFVTVLALGLMLALMTSLGVAQGPAPQDIAAPEEVVGTAFTYQGRLTDGGSPANGTYDFQFTLYDGSGNPLSTVVKDDVVITEGLFTVKLDFGGSAFKGYARYLEIGVRPGSSSGAYTGLSPRQELTPAPYALALPGLWTEQNTASPNVIGGYSLNYVTAGVVGATIGGGGFMGSENLVTDNYGTIGGGTSNQVGDDAGATDNASHATIGGGMLNEASGTGATICGGNGNRSGGYAFVGGGSLNAASGGSATIAGGGLNTASDEYAVVGGGFDNMASNVNATIAGGGSNVASGLGTTIAGGVSNVASGEYAVVGGGSLNEATGYAAVVAGGGGYSGDSPLPNTASASWSVVSGGVNNTASGAGAMVPGGNRCLAQGENSFAAGTQAKALHNGAFVWADDNYFDMASYGNNQFIARATGGVHFVLGIDGSGTPTWSCSAINGSSWTCSSDRNLKDNLVLVDGQDVLERLGQVPIYTWSAKGQDPTIRHIGPMAQDFYAAFQMGANDRQLATIDLDGVSLAAIQELYQLVQDQDAQIADLEARVAALEAATGSHPVQSSFPGSWLLVGGVVVAAVVVQRRYAGGER